MPRNDNHSSARERVAREAARIMLEGGVDDYQFAKNKAAARLKVHGKQSLPTNDQVEAAVGEYQRLFRAQTQPQHLRQLRIAALEAMRFLTQFQARLTGSVLRGTADEHSEVRLHLFSEPSEAVGLFLSDNDIPYVLGERRVRLSQAEQRTFPAYRLVAGEVAIELVVFDINSQRNPPLSTLDGKPMARADEAAVAALLGHPD